MSNIFHRPSPRPMFLEPAKRLDLKFYTSSVPKYLQAKLVVEKFGLVLRYFRSRTDPYTENYELGKEQLLSKAIDEIKRTVGRTSLFFVEDTSLRIDALSGSAQQDFPGLAVKEWFADTTFEALNAQLPKDVTGRRAVVKSDIALHVPGLDDPVMFHGETEGTIAATPPEFAENPHYPWLTPNSFNGWIIPLNATRRLGEMSLEESLEHDFRVRALIALIHRLEEYAAVLNAPNECYSSVAPVSAHVAQNSLFGQGGRALIVVGRICAGKTTFGLLANRHFPMSR
jgi:inosine/xanthosine triphosphate pyrophosphatase family protein